MSSSRLPTPVVTKWSGLKNQLKPAIARSKMSSEQKSLYLKALTKLYGEFDQGLSAKLKSASSSKDDNKAKTALADIVRITDLYVEKLDDFVEDADNDIAKGGEIHKSFKKTLQDLHEAAERTLSAMA